MHAFQIPNSKFLISIDYNPVHVRCRDQRFALTANGTTGRTEIIAGVTTFLTMAYIIFVEPAAVLKLATGRASEVHPLIYACAVLFLGRYMFLR